MSAILVVEPKGRPRACESALRAAGHRVLAAHEPESALGGALTSNPDLAVVDLGGTGPEGLELAARLQCEAMTAGMPVLVVNAPDSDEVRERALALGVVAVLEEELDDVRLVDLVAELLRAEPEPQL